MIHYDETSLTLRGQITYARKHMQDHFTHADALMEQLALHPSISYTVSCAAIGQEVGYTHQAGHPSSHSPSHLWTS